MTAGPVPELFGFGVLAGRLRGGPILRCLSVALILIGIRLVVGGR